MLIDFDSTGVEWYVFFRVSFHMNLLGGLFSRVVDLLLVMALMEMGNGFLFCHTESSTVFQRVVRYAAIISCAILAVVAFVSFGIMNALVASFSSPEDKLWSACEKLYASSSILLFIWAGTLVGFSTHVYNEVKRNRVLRNVSCPWLLQHRQKPVQDIPCTYYDLANSTATAVLNTVPLRRYSELIHSPILSRLRVCFPLSGRQDLCSVQDLHSHLDCRPDPYCLGVRRHCSYPSYHRYPQAQWIVEHRATVARDGGRKPPCSTRRTRFHGCGRAVARRI